MAFIKKLTSQALNVDERRQARGYAELTAGLDSVNPVARRWSARDLILYPESAAALVKRLKIEDDVSVREVIITTLIRFADEVAVAGLVGCLRSDDAAVRNEAIQAMKQLPDEVAPIMQGLLADPDSDVRIFAVNVLESLRHPQVEAWLIRVIETDAHVNVCATALDLLSEVGTAEAVAALTALKDRFASMPYIQFSADLALKRIDES